MAERLRELRVFCVKQAWIGRMSVMSGTTSWTWAFWKGVGLGVAVGDGVPEAKAAADYVTKAPGGNGAIREIVEMILKAQQKWKAGRFRICELSEQKNSRAILPLWAGRFVAAMRDAFCSAGAFCFFFGHARAVDPPGGNSRSKASRRRLNIFRHRTNSRCRSFLEGAESE